MARTPAATRSPFQKEPEGIRDRSDPGDRDLRPDLRCRPSPENVADQHLRARQCGVGGPPPAACRWSATWGVAASKSGPTLVSLPREVLARHVSPGGARWRRARCPRRGDRGPGSSRCGLGGGPRGDPGHPPNSGAGISEVPGSPDAATGSSPWWNRYDLPGCFGGSWTHAASSASLPWCAAPGFATSSPPRWNEIRSWCWSVTEIWAVVVRRCGSSANSRPCPRSRTTCASHRRAAHPGDHLPRRRRSAPRRRTPCCVRTAQR